MPDWEEDSEQLRANLLKVLLAVRADAVQRTKPTIENARTWHREMMHLLTPPAPEYVGRFRGEAGLESCEVTIGGRFGVHSNEVAVALKSFEATLQEKVEALDQQVAPGQELSAEQLADAINLCAWAHAEWVRIHPFGNGNGRTARIWANFIAIRYGLPPFVRLRPRPDGDYNFASLMAMFGKWEMTTSIFKRMYIEEVRRK
jgi:Fic family protein